MNGLIKEGYLGIVDTSMSGVDKDLNIRPTKEKYYLDIALSVSKRSTCLKRHYGAVIVNNDEIISTGYNGNPRGLLNCCEGLGCKRINKPHNTGDYSDCNSVHAEQNALLSASRRDMIGGTLYLVCEEYGLDKEKSSRYQEDFFDFNEVTKDIVPCPICMRMIQNSGIKRIVTRGGDICI